MFQVTLPMPAMPQTSAIDKALAGATNGLSRRVLDNGMVVLLKDDPSAPLVSAQVWIGTGSANEQEYFGGGLSHWMEHMIFKGTPARPPGTIAKIIGDLGGSVNAYTTFDRTVFWVEVPAPHWRTALEVLADALKNASFPEDEWRREKDVIRREMAMEQDNPGRQVFRLLSETAFRVHPYRAPVLGYPEVFEKLTREDLLVFFRRHYTPNNMLLVLAGGAPAAAAEPAIRELFGAWPRQARAPAPLPAEPEQIAERTARRAGPYAVTRVEICWHTAPLTHPDVPDLDLLAAVAGHGTSSRLVREIKDRLKLAHEINAWSFTLRDAGLFGISAECEPEKEAALLEALDRETERWTRDPFAPGELEKARRMQLVETLSSFQTPGGQANNFASGDFYAGSPAFFQTYLRRLASATPESVRAAARRYLRTENRTTAVLSPETTNAAAAAAPPAPAAPKVEKSALAGGVTLLTREDRRLPMVWISAVCGGGLLLENETNNGITCLMAELLTRGARDRSADAIAQAVESLGASLAAYAGRNTFGLRAQCLTGDVPVVMELLADCLLAPTFAPDEVAKQKPIQAALIRQQRESPFFIAKEALWQTLFPGHPYRFAPEGSLQAVASLTADDLKAWHAGLAVNQNIVLAVFGDISADQARALAERHFKQVAPGGRPPATCAPPRPALPQRVHRREPREQTIFLAGFPGVDLLDPRNDALMVLQQALTGMSSDLFASVREKQGLAYFAGAIQEPGVMPGVFAIYVGTRAAALERVEGLVRQEILRVAGAGLRGDEFDRARQKLMTSQLQRLQLNGELAFECALNELYGRGYTYALDMENRLKSLTPQAIRDAAASVLNTNQMAISVVTPLKEPAE